MKNPILDWLRAPITGPRWQALVLFGCCVALLALLIWFGEKVVP